MLGNGLHILSAGDTIMMIEVTCNMCGYPAYLCSCSHNGLSPRKRRKKVRIKKLKKLFKACREVSEEYDGGTKMFDSVNALEHAVRDLEQYIDRC